MMPSRFSAMNAGSDVLSRLRLQIVAAAELVHQPPAGVSSPCAERVLPSPRQFVTGVGDRDAKYTAICRYVERMRFPPAPESDILCRRFAR